MRHECLLRRKKFVLNWELLETFRLRSDPPRDNSEGGLRTRLKLGGTRVGQGWEATARVQAKCDETVNQATLVEMV